MTHTELKQRYEHEVKQLEIEMAKVEALNKAMDWILGRKDEKK